MSQRPDNHGEREAAIGTKDRPERPELGIEHRQVFFLFAGLAVGAGLVFSLGVMVGKRWRATVERAAVQTREDPLARLDVSADDLVPGTELSYPRELGRAAPRPAPAAGPAEARAAAAPAPAKATATARPNAPAARQVLARAPAAGKTAAPTRVAASAKVAVPARAPAAGKAAAPSRAPARPVLASAPASRAPAPTEPAEGDLRPVAALGATAPGFRRRSDAEALAARLAARGQKVRVMRVQRTGAATTYRVRSGTVASRTEASSSRR